MPPSTIMPIIAMPVSPINGKRASASELTQVVLSCAPLGQQRLEGQCVDLRRSRRHHEHRHEQRGADQARIALLVAPGGESLLFDDVRLPGGQTHGTGCTLSSAVATLLGHGQTLPHAVRLARHGVLQPHLLRRVADLHDTSFGVYGTVVTSGIVRRGDAVQLCPASK